MQILNDELERFSVRNDNLNEFLQTIEACTQFHDVINFKLLNSLIKNLRSLLHIGAIKGNAF